MKYLKIGLGGHNLLGDDVHYLEDGLAEGLTGFIEAFCEDFTILTGCVHTITTVVSANDTITWTGGWIYMQGEFLKVDAGSAPYSGGNYWEIVETFDATGDQVYVDLSTAHPYVVRKAALTGVGSSPYVFTAAKRLKSWKKNTIITTLGSWTSPGAASYYATNLIGNVMMKGALAVTSYSNTTDSVLFNVSATHRPTAQKTLITAALIGTTHTCVHITVDTNGDVKPLGLVNGTAVTIYLDSLNYFL